MMKRLGMLMVGVWVVVAEAAGGADDPWREVCIDRQRLIGEALACYAYENEGAYPEHLGDLVPTYLAEGFVLQCPAAILLGWSGLARASVIDLSRGDRRTHGYSWELNPNEYIYVSGGKPQMSFGTLKRLQMATPIGDRVPIVRCWHSYYSWNLVTGEVVYSGESGDMAGGGEVLNLTRDGRIYESGNYWECLYVDVVPWPYLAPELVAMSRIPMEERLRERPATASSELLDLRPWCNARIEDPWIFAEWGQELKSFEDSLENGLLRHDGVAFDAAGLIQLNGRLMPEPNGPSHPYTYGYRDPHYPEKVEGIAAGQSFHRLHLLGGVLFDSPAGTEVARLKFIRAGEAPSSMMRWIYGRDVAGLYFRRNQGVDHDLEGARVAWTGVSDLPFLADFGARLFHLTWDNPMPDVVVEKMDFYHGDQASAPFLLAITVEK